MFSKKILTICIPTYNRKERLLNQLRSIFNQLKYSCTNIVILDNCSNYNVLQELNNSFSEKELSNVELIQRPYNIGMVGNLSTSFLYCKTKWMWLLSDDDETCKESIDLILENIEKNPDIAVFKFSIEGFAPEEDKIISTINEFIEYYKSGLHKSGNMIFISNNVFNLDILNPYLGYTNVYSYTYVPHLVSVIAGLSEKKIQLKFCPENIVKYISPDPSSKWNFLQVLLGISSFADIDFGLDKKQHHILCMLVFRNFSLTTLISQLFRIKDRWRRKYIFKKIFSSFYGYETKKRWISYLIFYFIYYSRIDKVCDVGKFWGK